jgi:hypothetical protein
MALHGHTKVSGSKGKQPQRNEIHRARLPCKRLVVARDSAAAFCAWGEAALTTDRIPKSARIRINARVRMKAGPAFERRLFATSALCQRQPAIHSGSSRSSANPISWEARATQGIFSEGIDTGQLSRIFNHNFGHTVNFTLSANRVYKGTMVADALHTETRRRETAGRSMGDFGLLNGSFRVVSPSW